MGLVKCRGCRKRIPKDQAIALTGLGFICSDPACRTTLSRRRVSRKPSVVPDVVRQNVLARDRHRCRSCGHSPVQVHHIEYRSQGGLHVEHNLVALCGRCHVTVHSDKRRYQPVLRQLIWLHYVEGRRVSLTYLLRRVQ